MKILYIIGNGFDINLKMNTRYVDFYKYYISTDSKSNLISKLKSEISGSLTNWADLELALGEYTENIDTLEEFDEIFDDISLNLSEYLIKEEKKIDYTKIKKEDFSNYLIEPGLFLAQLDIDELISFRQKWINADRHVNIITLNYTRSIENILGKNVINTRIGTVDGRPVYFRKIEHIHGYTDIRMILGVHDKTQIKNEKLHDQEDILNALIKTQSNKTQGHGVDNLCINEIKAANLICIFGSSLGDTDKYLWELIGEQLKKDIRLIIYMREKELDERLGHKIVRTRQKTKKFFLEKTNLNEEEKKDAENKIYIGVNRDFFKLI